MIRRLVKLAAFFTEYAQDLYYFMRYNSHSPFVPSAVRTFYRAIIETHTIEKGLALPSPRAQFGEKKITAISQLLSRYPPTHSAFPIEMAAGALRDYLAFNRRLGVVGRGTDAAGTLLKTLEPVAEQFTGGVREISFGSDATPPEKYIEFIKSRYSCRQFEATPPTLERISQALNLAQSAPSQCNRQSSCVHVYQEPQKVKELLRLQAGSAGFDENVPTLLLITSDLRAWGGPQQRNQAYVDGALFAMTLMLSLQAYGLASCPLNLAITNERERRIRRLANVGAHERLIMMIATGIPRAAASAAKSPRRPLAEIVRFH